MTSTDEIMFTHDSSVIDRLKALSDCCEWANLGWDLPGSATANIKRICDDAISELSKAMTDPMNVGWQHAEAARKDRAAAVSQWRTERKRAERAEAELAEARLKHKEDAWQIVQQMHELAETRKDAERLREKLVIFACSKHTHKCYICYTEWSEGAPDIHKPDCLLARDGHRIDAALAKEPKHD